MSRAADVPVDPSAGRAASSLSSSLGPADGAVAVASTEAGLADAGCRLAEVEAECGRLRRLATVGLAAAAAAHEINNLLTPVLGYAEAAWAQPGNAVLQTRALEQSHRGAVRMAELTSRLLEVARGADTDADAHSLDPIAKPAPTEPDTAPRCRVERSVEQAWSATHVDPGPPTTPQRTPPSTPVVRLEGHIEPAEVAIDAARLEQVLINLMVNARRAMGDAGGVLRVVGARDRDSDSDAGGDGDRARYRLRVEDTGPGVPAGLRRRLFQPFASAPTGGSGGASGTGLGLAICRDLLRVVGGEVRYDERYTAGAAFELTLPLAQAHASESASSSTGERARGVAA